MGDSKGVPLVRVEAEEKLYDATAIFGRDADDVFPTEAKQNIEEYVDGQVGGIGGLKFVTEAEIHKIKEQRGDRPEDGTLSVDKSLAQVLAENKEAKEEAFQEVWRSMKEGKNRPLDDDEAEFLESVAKSEWRANRAHKEQEDEQLVAFQLARAEMENVVTKPALEPEQIISSDLLGPKPLVKRNPASMLLRVKPVVKTSNKKARVETSEPLAAPVAVEEDRKAATTGGLLGLMDYGSDSDED